jgi:tRNA threonylcarbamoyladenosine biosynthesis protein TsaE
MQREFESRVVAHETSCSSETEELGARLAKDLSVGDVVLVHGELGTGKTTLVRGAARALGVDDPVTSPTFSIGHRYRGTGATVSHLDLYRLREFGEDDLALLEDYFNSTVAFVEWPEVAEANLPWANLRVTLTHMGGERRRIEVVRLA